jgi:hypothetical protein
MEMKLKSIGAFTIVSAIIWGAVILGCSFELKGTECYGNIQNILVGGVLSHIILIWGPLAVIFNKAKESKPDDAIKE